jgi:uncharacterized protein YmfQ (DUF2313 family)
MSVKITDNSNNIKNQTTIRASIFLRSMTDEIVKISTPKTPKRRGNLRQDIIKQVLGLNAKIIWGKNYAARQELIQHKTYTTPGTGPHFAENAVKGAANQIGVIAKRVGLI